MVFYLKQGELPEARHTYISESKLYKEELFGEESFDGPYSLLYHLNEPTRVRSIRRVNKPDLVANSTDELLHRHLKGSILPRADDFIKGRRYLLFNEKVFLGVSKPRTPMESFFRHALCDQLFYVHSGYGVVKSVLGDLPFRKGDYIYVPKGTTYTAEYSSESEFFFVESKDRIGIPSRYLNVYGQLKEGTPYYSRDIVCPTLKKPIEEKGDFKILVDFNTHYLVEERDSHPFDLIGWDGYLYPFSLNVDSIAPIVGKLHQPPPVHETFSGKSFMVGTFLPRKFDFHPKAIPISYYHSNVDTDEVIFYSSGNFMSRKGIDEGSITIHVRGLIHGPQPGAVKQSLGKEGTDEVAVMVEVYDPLRVSEEGSRIEDTNYIKSWYT